VSIFDIFWPVKPIDWDEFPPMMPIAFEATDVKKSMHDMLMVCLGGGMAYDDAKIAVEKEYGGALEAADTRDGLRQEHYLKRLEEWKQRRAQKK